MYVPTCLCLLAVVRCTRTFPRLSQNDRRLHSEQEQEKCNEPVSGSDQLPHQVGIFAYPIRTLNSQRRAHSVHSSSSQHQAARKQRKFPWRQQYIVPTPANQLPALPIIPDPKMASSKAVEVRKRTYVVSSVVGTFFILCCGPVWAKPDEAVFFF